MIDPGSAIAIITTLYQSYKEGKEIGKWLDGLYYGDDTILQAGINYYENAEQSSNSDDQVKNFIIAIHYFENSIGKKKYIDATAYFYLALSNCRIGKFEKSYQYLELLSGIETNTGTVRKNSIEDFKKHGKTLKGIVIKTENEYKNQIQEKNKLRESRQLPAKTINKKKLAYFIIFIIVLAYTIGLGWKSGLMVLFIIVTMFATIWLALSIIRGLMKWLRQ